MKGKLIAFLGVALAIGILAGIVIVPRMMSSGGATVASWLIHVEAETLVEASDRILVAKFVDDRNETLDQGTAPDGIHKGSITERYRRFTVVEVLKGEGSVGDEVYLATTDRSVHSFGGGVSSDTEYDVVELTNGTEYVLFLRGVSRPEGHPAKYGEKLWISPGEPCLAQMDERGRLTFLATDIYVDLLSQGDLEPVPGSAAPFELTKNRIIEMVAG